MTELDGRPAVVAFITEVAKAYTGRRLSIELVPAATTAARAIVFDDGEAWRILADERMPPRQLFHALFHELGHVCAGDVRRVDRLVLEHVHAAMTGKAGVWPQAFRHVLEQCDGAEAENEAKIDEWARVEAARWWPLFEATMINTLTRLEEAA